VKEIKLLRIDESLIPDHVYLTNSDKCYFIGEYASGQGFSYSEMNQVINNFKKPINRKNLPEWNYKEKEINKIASWLQYTKAWNKLKHYTWVPMPSSKVKSDLSHDDALLRILKCMKKRNTSLDVREVLQIRRSREAAHTPGVKRPTVEDHIENMFIDNNQIGEKPSGIIIFDDIITTGAGFKAAQYYLKNTYPDVPMIGIFVARSVFVAPVMGG
jgi:hypothetical protein